MKKILYTVILGLTFINSYSEDRTNPYLFIEQKEAYEKINVIFENNGNAKEIVKFELTIIEPNGNKIIEELSLGEMSRRKTVSISVGSKIYLKNSAKLNTLIGGRIPADSEAFMVVMLRDRNQSIHLVEETNATQQLIEANAQKSADKLKLESGATKSTLVNGNTVTITYTDASGIILAEFDCDKKSGNVKNIADLRKKEEEKKTTQEPENKGINKAKGLLGK
jgi:uncharacterized protein YxeA